MANVVHVQTNFTAGEISPRLLGRNDLAKYNNGARTVENAVVETHGGLSKRSGSKYVAEIYSTGAAPITTALPRLVEFHYNTDESYVIEFGVTASGGNNGLHATPTDNGYIRFFRLDSTTKEPIILKEGGSGAIIDIVGLKWVDSELPNLKFTQSADTLFIFCPTRPVQTLTRSGVDTAEANWVVEEYDFVDGPYQSLNTTKLKMAVDGTGAIDGTLTLTVSNGTTDEKRMFTASDIGSSVRLEDPVESFKVTGFTKGVESTNAAQGDPAVVTVSGNMTTAFEATSAVNRRARVEFFNVKRGPTILEGTMHEGRKFSFDGDNNQTTFELWNANTGTLEDYHEVENVSGSAACDGECRIVNSNQAGWGVIAAMTGGNDGSGNYSQCTITVKNPFVSIQATKQWRLGAWSKATGYPQNGTFPQNRLWCASTTSEPQTLHASEVNVYNNFSPNDLETATVVDSQAMRVTLASRQVNAINHMRSDSQGLMIFTAGGEWIGRASQPSAPITPTDINFSKQSSYGSLADVEPVRFGTSYLMFQRDARTLREYTYEFGQDRFVAPNVTILAEHITKNKVVDMTFQMGGQQRAWMCTSTGELLCLTYDKTQDVMAWSRHIMAKSGSTPVVGQVKTVARTTDGNEDNIWMIVQRTIGSTVKYFVEMLEQDFTVAEEHAEAFFVDCGISVTHGSPSTTVSGLDHLIGQDVYALVDGVQYAFTAALGNAINGSGEITTLSATNVQVGLLYSVVVETLPLNVTQGLEVKAKRKRLFSSFANMYRSLSGKLGTPDQVYDIEYPTATQNPPELRTSMVEVSMPDNSNREMIVRYEQEDVHPSNLLSITSEIHLGV